MEALAAFEIAAIVLMLIGLRLLRGRVSDHGAGQRIAEAIAIGVLAGTLVLATGLVLSAAVQARSALAGGVALTMLMAPLMAALLGAAPWALLGGIALVVVGV
jgi:Mg/Co/Ni transporter MgtE